MSKFLNINAIIVFFVLTLFSIGFSAAETLTVTTYYPSPYGSYQELRVNQMTVGSAYATVALANGNVFIEGNVGIGASNTAGYRVYINGNIYVNGDVVTDTTTYSDYVFEPDYRLKSLQELKEFISNKKHLPNMPSAREVRKNGVKFFEQNRLMLEKLEEAYLYIIELENRVAKLEAKIGSESKDGR